MMLERRQRMRWSRSVAAELIARCREGGMNVAEFCRTEGISRSSFDLWRRRLAGESRSGVRVPFVELQVEPPSQPGFSDNPVDALEVCTSDGLRVRVPAGWGLDGFEEVVRVLRSQS